MLYLFGSVYTDDFFNDISWNTVGICNRCLKIGSNINPFETGFFNCSRSAQHGSSNYGYHFISALPGYRDEEQRVQDRFYDLNLPSHAKTEKSGKEFFEYDVRIIKYFEFGNIIYGILKSYIGLGLTWDIRRDIIRQSISFKLSNLSSNLQYKFDNSTDLKLVDYLTEKLYYILNNLSLLINFMYKILDGYNFYYGCYISYYRRYYDYTMECNTIITYELVNDILEEFRKKFIDLLFDSIKGEKEKAIYMTNCLEQKYNDDLRLVDCIFDKRRVKDFLNNFKYRFVGYNYEDNPDLLS